EDGIRDPLVTGVQTCALPIYPPGDATALARGAAHMALDRRYRAQVLDRAVRPHVRPAVEERRARPAGAQDRPSLGDQPRRAGGQIGRASCRERGCITEGWMTM